MDAWDNCKLVDLQSHGVKGEENVRLDRVNLQTWGTVEMIKKLSIHLN